MPVAESDSSPDYNGVLDDVDAASLIDSTFDLPSLKVCPVIAVLVGKP